MDKRLIYYLTGPISRIRQCNVPLFESATAALRASGYQIISPIELDGPELRDAYMAGEPVADSMWGAFLGRDVVVVADDVGGLILLPGWQQSRGARLEVFVGLVCCKAFGLYDPASETASATDSAHIRTWLRNTL